MKKYHSVAGVIILTVLWVGGIITYEHIPFVQSMPASNLIYESDFEHEENWQMFEEIVGGNACYGDGIGSVIRSMDVAYEGQQSLLVWANQDLSEKSNHVIGFKNIAAQGLNGVIRYQVHTYIASDTLLFGQTGPEFSMQNTRGFGSTTTTAIAGVQYIANPYWKTGYWNIWNEGDWTTFITTTQPLEAGTWYTLTLEANFTNNQYLSFSIQGGEINSLFDISTYHIAEEDRGFAEAFVITLESENLWNNCGTAGNFNYKVYYDRIAVSQILEFTYLPFLTNNSFSP